MSIQPNDRKLSLLGLIYHGDLGPLTMYRSHLRRRVVAFLKTRPDKPPTPAQIENRNRMKEAAGAWRDLPSLARDQWELATRRASLCLTGYNLYTYWHFTGNDSAILTLARQTSTTLL